MADKPAGEATENNEIVLRLCADPRSVREARHAAGDLCRSGGLAPLADDAELLASELVTNACRAATNIIIVTLLRAATGLVVAVTDDDETPVAAPTGTPRGDALTGRGLHLVDKIASDWGALQHDSNGKTVWFRLDARPSAAWQSSTRAASASPPAETRTRSQAQVFP